MGKKASKSSSQERRSLKSVRALHRHKAPKIRVHRVRQTLFQETGRVSIQALRRFETRDDGGSKGLPFSV